jgi:hypothetical protein
LIAEEKAEQIAAARQMAQELARQQRDFIDRLAKSNLNSGGEGDKPTEPAAGVGSKPVPPKEGEEEMPGLGAARQIAEKAETLKDVLGAAAGAKNPEDEPAAEKIQAILGSMKLDDVLERLKNLPDQLGSGQADDAKSAAEEGAERLEETASALDSLYRGVVAPQLEALAKAEKALSGLEEDLEKLEKPADINGWHLRAEDLADDLEKAGVNEELRNEFAEVVQNGLGDSRKAGSWAWVRVDSGYYAAPASYKRVIVRLQATLRGQLQELILGEQISQRDEPTPPQYQDLVDRFYKVLAVEGKVIKKKDP